MKVSATPTALELIEDLKKTHGKDLLFHQSGGCCDGSAPMCYPAKEYMSRRSRCSYRKNRWYTFLY